VTTKVERPAPPRRPFSLILPLLLAAVGFAVGGLTAVWVQGFVWGAIAGAGTLLAFRFASFTLSAREQAVVLAGIVASAVLSTLVLPDVPERVTPLSGLRFGAAWLPAGAAMACTALQRKARLSAALNIGIVWPAAGVAGFLGALAFDVLVPIAWQGPVDEPSFGGAIFATMGFIIGLVGFGGTLSMLSRLPSLGAAVAALFMSAYAGAQVGFTIPGLVRNFANVTKVPNLWPPEFDWAIGDSGTWWALWTWEFGPRTFGDPLIETFRIAIIASIVGCTIAIPVAFMASKLTTLNTAVYLPDKAFMNLIRTVPDLFWAMIFVTAVGAGAGPFAGTLALSVFSLAIMAKLLSETIDAADPGPLEAAKATGGKHFPAIRTAVFPQVLPNYVAYALYIFEINIRASVVIGLVGAGGIGRILESQRVFFEFDRVLAVIVAIFVIVFLIEQVSVALRRRLV
jgi:phosphonate transport system permease protein